jgi:hypothetical protein
VDGAVPYRYEPRSVNEILNGMPERPELTWDDDGSQCRGAGRQPKTAGDRRADHGSKTKQGGFLSLACRGSLEVPKAFMRLHVCALLRMCGVGHRNVVGGVGDSELGTRRCEWRWQCEREREGGSPSQG